MKKLGFGFMRLPVLDENDLSTVDIDTVKKMVELFMARGFTYFDTAHRYNDEASEPALREALVKPYPRDSYVLANKITLNYIKSADEQEAFFKGQLSICSVEYFDNYLIHNMGAVWYPVAEKFGTFDFIKRMRDEGYTRKIGFSFHGTADVLEEILKAHAGVDFVQLQINYLDWEDSGIQSRKCYEVARKYDKQIVVMEPVKGGTLVNLPDEAEALLKNAEQQASLASWAIRYAAGLDGVITVLSGMSTTEQVADNTGYMQDFKPLTAHEKFLVAQAVEIIRSKATIACTNCRYCTAECPQNIAIPDFFNLYNNMKRLKNTSYLANQPVYYANLAKTNGKASACVRCGICEKNCPQNLLIRELLQKVANEME
ncbi:MAG: aldo/keto reductase [Clostridiales bacterium]|jgi:predicted aldo/keto reductase-like oxidoreductase|nr:aldo/keto reductase [Clostridiales bacterium]